MDHDLVAGLPARDARADLPDDRPRRRSRRCGGRTPGGRRSEHRHRLAERRPHVVEVHAGRHHAHDDLEGAGLGDLDLLELEGVDGLALALRAGSPRRPSSRAARPARRRPSTPALTSTATFPAPRSDVGKGPKTLPRSGDCGGSTRRWRATREATRPTPKAQKAHGDSDVAHQPAEVHAEEAGQQGSGRKIVATMVSRSMTTFSRFDTRREVDVHRAGEQVAVGVDRVGEADEVVVRRRGSSPRVAGSSPGSLLQVLAGAEEQVALRPDDPPQPREIALELRDALELLVGGPLEHLVLERVDLVVDALQDREEGSVSASRMR